MQLDYKTTAADYQALIAYQLEKTILGRRFSTVAWIGISVCAWLSVALPLYRLGWTSGAYVRSALAMAITIGFPFLYNWYSSAIVRDFANEARVEGLAGPTVLTISAEGIAQASALMTIHCDWAKVKRLVCHETHDFVELTDLVSLAIPARAFRDDGQRVAFRAEIARLMGGAGSVRESIPWGSRPHQHGKP